jgi:hypothetical protein
MNLPVVFCSKDGRVWIEHVQKTGSTYRNGGNKMRYYRTGEFREPREGEWFEGREQIPTQRSDPQTEAKWILRRTEAPTILTEDISGLYLSVRLKNCLMNRLNCKTVLDAIRVSENDLYSCKGMGRKARDEYYLFLATILRESVKEKP